MSVSRNRRENKSKECGTQKARTALTLSIHSKQLNQAFMKAKILKQVTKSILSIRESQALFDNMHISEDQTSDEIIINTEKNPFKIE